MAHQEAMAVPFNRGCDARLAGRSLDVNPYPMSQPQEREMWKDGWTDVDDLARMPGYAIEGGRLIIRAA